MIYGKQGIQRLFIAYTYSNGSGYRTLSIRDYHGMSVKVLKEVQEFISGCEGKTVVITNWKELRP